MSFISCGTLANFRSSRQDVFFNWHPTSTLRARDGPVLFSLISVRVSSTHALLVCSRSAYHRSAGLASCDHYSKNVATPVMRPNLWFHLFLMPVGGCALAQRPTSISLNKNFKVRPPSMLRPGLCAVLILGTALRLSNM